MYNWDIEQLKEKLKVYKQRANVETDIQTLIELHKTISSLEQVINYYEATHNPTPLQGLSFKKPNLRQIASNDREILTKFKSYYPYINQMLTSLDSLVVIPNPNLPRIKRSKNHIITVSAQFFSQFGSEIQNAFSTIQKTLPTHLEFRKLTGAELSFANTLSIYNSVESYYDIGLANNVQDYMTVIHELGHGIAQCLNPNFNFDNEKYCFKETDTLFWELVAYDFLSELLNLPKDFYLISLTYLKEYSYGADLICTKGELHEAFPSLQSFAQKRQIITYLKKKYRCNNTYLNDILYSEASDMFNYEISYLTATELYLIYKENPQYAIDLLIKIIKAKNLSSQEYLEFVKNLGITPGEHIKEYVDTLIDKGKELDHGKRLYYQRKLS